MPPQPQPQYAMAANYALAGAGTIPMQMIAAVAPPSPVAVTRLMTLRIGFRQFSIASGMLVTEDQAPGMQAQSPGGPVAEVVSNPRDPSVLGLTNLSRSTWESVSSSGNRHSIQPFQTVRLTAGTRIDFGNLDGEVS